MVFFQLDEKQVDFEQFYDYETDTYYHKFKNPKTLESLKSLHQDYFTQKEKQDQQKILLQTKEESLSNILRPTNLKTDFQLSFVQISSQQKIYDLRSWWQYLPIQNCWASSRYEFYYIYSYWWRTYVGKKKGKKQYINILHHYQWYDWSSFPCPTRSVPLSWRYWLSELIKIDQSQKEITFKWQYSQVERIYFIVEQIKIETSQDLVNWETTIDYEKLLNDTYYMWFWHTKYLDPFVYAKGVRIIMKGFRDQHYWNRHGIWAIHTYTKTQSVMILEKNSPQIPNCMVSAEREYWRWNRPNMLMNCYEAIMQNDMREIYFLHGYKIRQYADWACLVPQNQPSDNKTQFIVSTTCSHQKKDYWKIDRLSKIQSQFYDNKCLASLSDDAIENFAQYGSVSVSSSMSDSRVNPYAVIDPNGHGFWAPPNDIAHATMKINFSRMYSLKKIIVKWKNKPPKFEIQVRDRWQEWITIVFDKPKDDLDLEIPLQEIIGFRITLLDLLERTPMSDQNTFYGIKKIELKRGGQIQFFYNKRKAISLQSCDVQDDQSKIMNRWKLEPVEYINSSYWVPYIYSNHYMGKNYNQSVSLIRDFMSKLTRFRDIVQKAIRIKQTVQKMETNYDLINQKFKTVQEDFQKFDEGKVGDFPDYAGSPYQAAGSCQKIKQNTDYKLNGFYWVQTTCMPKPQRVYCDFIDNFGNFYLYHGHNKYKVF